MRGLDGKVAFVTGGASGIGAATCRRLADEGARIVVADRDAEGATLVAKEVEGFAVAVDVTDTDAVNAAVAEARAEMGPIDVLVNNAGGDRIALFVDSDEQTWDSTIALNLKSTIACTHAVLREMLTRRSGSIVNVASEAGRLGTAGGALYSAAKAGVIGFTKAIAREGAGFGVRCNAVTPGPIDTPLLNGAAEAAGAIGAKVKQMMIDATIVKRLGQPEEVAAAIAFLASDDASFITGHALAVSGGVSMA
jgi:2-hydroxycyclohexanecarboxyl-CoA dehydrogenase